ncbi:MAG: ABC transporter substrate-binding protein [bacterium]|nr:ABC transporter substrate-binding protein [bacterium]
MQTRRFSLCVILILLLMQAVTFSEPVKVAIVKAKDMDADEILSKGIKQKFKDSGIEVEIKEFSMDESENLSSVKAQNPKVIITVGSSLTKKAMSDAGDIPIVFTMVIDPEGSGLKGKNLTGASLEIPMDIQFKKFKEILPSLKSIGIIYNPEENERIITDAKTAGEKNKIELKAFPVSSAKDIPKVETMDVSGIIIIPDTIVCKSTIIKYLLDASIKGKVPIMGFSPSYAKAGALFSLTPDYEDIGVQTAEIAVKIIKGESPEKIPVTKARKINLYVNTAVAEWLEITVPDSILNEAKEKFGK